MLLALSIGRNPDNNIILPYPQVSGKHAILTQITPNTLLLEDLGSVNGTFVNGLQVARMVILPTDKIKLANIGFDIAKHLPQILPSNLPNGLSSVIKPNFIKKDNDYTQEFSLLAEVYSSYETQKNVIKKGDLWKKTALRAGLSVIPFVGSAIAIVICEKISNDEKLIALDNELKTHYVCPKCKNFLGYYPFIAVAAKRTCLSCKAIWVK